MTYDARRIRKVASVLLDGLEDTDRYQEMLKVIELVLEQCINRNANPGFYLPIAREGYRRIDKVINPSIFVNRLFEITPHDRGERDAEYMAGLATAIMLEFNNLDNKNLSS